MSNKIKILFVEDLQTDAEMARRALKKEKIDVISDNMRWPW